jgi:hypothetical protein
MPSDGLLVGLITASITAPASPRRVAAEILLEGLQSKGSAALPKEVERVKAEIGPKVANEMQALIAEYGLADELDPQS